ncbi:MAG: M1 family metallopeptidase [Flavobacteriales bacterium]
MRKLFSILVFAIAFQAVAQQKYFQQEVNTTIKVILDDVNHTLKGHISIEYINNSPHALEHIFIHLWPNAYKNGKTALAKQLFEDGELDLFYEKPEAIGYIDSLNFTTQKESLKWEYHKEHIDIARLLLNKPLNPGERIVISTPFFVKIPIGTISRLGHIGQSYQITQWFPKPAVFDNTGWHYMPYLTQGEFYSEFGSYDVSITLPANYVVGATGDFFQCETEERFLDSLVQATEAYIQKNTNLLRESSGQMVFPPSSDKWKTIRFKQNNVHDFAWFADKRYHVLKGEIELPYSKRKVKTWAMFTNAEAHLWQKSIEYLNDATYYYSLWNGEYPYNHVTAVDGSISAGGGMEYPNVTVIGTSHNDLQLETVIVHEVGHNWFYGILGSNERKNAWMDEGFNSFNESRYFRTKYPNARLANQLGGQNPVSEYLGLNRFELTYADELFYSFSARGNIDQPMQLKAQHYTSLNYGAIVYKKTALALRYLMDYLGEELYDQCMQTYYKEWMFKHPSPADVCEVFERVSGKDLTWFFTDVVRTTRKMDYALTGLSKSGTKGKKEYEVKVRNFGSLQSPVPVDVIKGDSIVKTVWVDGFSGKKKVNLGEVKDFDKLVIDSRYNTMDLYRKNNNLRKKGPLKTIEPIQFKLLGQLENPNKTSVYFMPVLGWNQYNKTMAGVAFYNSIVPKKKVEYVLVPMYAFGSQSFAGTGQVKAHIKPQSWFRNIDLGVNAAIFDFFNQENVSATFQKYSPWVELTPWKNYLRSPHQNKITLKANIINHQFASVGEYAPRHLLVNYALRHTYSKRHTLRPFSLHTELEYGSLRRFSSFNSDKPVYNPNQDFRFNYFYSNTTEEYLKLSTEFAGSVKYNQKGRKLNYRLFGGYFFMYESNVPYFAWRMDGQNGMYDYNFDHVFLGRSAGYPNFLGQQMQENHGGFKTFTSFGQSSSWIAATNLRWEIPVGPKLALFADFGLYPYTNVQGEKTVGNLYDAGVEIPLFSNAVRIFIPLLISEDIQRQHDFMGINFWQRIRFQVNFNALNPFNLINSISF